MFGVKKAKVLV